MDSKLEDHVQVPLQQSSAELNALKSTILSRQKAVRTDLASIAEQYQKIVRQGGFGEPGTVQYYVARTLDWFGVGPRYQRKVILKKMGETSATLGVICDNLRQEQESYAEQKGELSKEICQDQQLLAINKGLADNWYHEIQETKIKLATLRSGSPFSESTSAEQMLLERRMLERRVDSDRLDLEQDMTVMRLEGAVAKEEMCTVGYELATAMLSEFGRQKMAFDLQRDRVEFFERTRKGTGNFAVMHHYAEAARLIGKLSTFAESTYENPFNKLPQGLRVSVAGATGGNTGERQSYWRANYGRLMERLEKFRQ